MVFSTAEIEGVRTVMGFDRLWLAQNPFLDSALQAIQFGGGGSAPDATVENAVRNALAKVFAIDGYIFQILSEPTNLAVLEIPTALTNGATLKQDYRRALRSLRKNGTDQIQIIAIALGLEPLRTYFYSDGVQEKASDFLSAILQETEVTMFLDGIRLAIDNGLGIVARKGLQQYQVWLVTVVNDQVAFDDTSGIAVRTNQRLTVSTGYASWINPDGYMNPGVYQISSERLVLAMGSLSADEVWIGPFVLPYAVNGVTGGSDPIQFHPSIGSNDNLQDYIWIKGIGLPPQGSYFDIKRVALGPMHNIDYYLVCQATSQRIPE